MYTFSEYLSASLNILKQIVFKGSESKLENKIYMQICLYKQGIMSIMKEKSIYICQAGIFCIIWVTHEL